MLQDLVVLVIVLALASGPIIYGLWISKKRKSVRADCTRRVREVLLDAKLPIVTNRLMDSSKTWVEAQNNLRRRRRSIPRIKSHI